MREIRLENEKLQKRNEELENFYRANNTRVVFKKRNPLDALTTETEPSKIDNQKTNQDPADRKKESEKEHIDTGKTLKKDTNTSEREQRKESNNKIPQSSIITSTLMTPTDASHSAGFSNSNIRLSSSNIRKRVPIRFSFPPEKEARQELAVEKEEKLFAKKNDNLNTTKHETKEPQPQKKSLKSVLDNISFYYGECQPEYQPHGPSPAQYGESWVKKCEKSILSHH
ncbi:hypothetical protein B9Z55_023505 [Caenorhabditis nigoni]|uniref:Uncharacterized protein n=1 Tax=Caenorhabditis nigoni TaxID=1611254 RepID=A0A2G5SQP0_9PELO|nr:hypothetical protein B9Z55_023505 [Caenorhabditis nigoni]